MSDYEFEELVSKCKTIPSRHNEERRTYLVRDKEYVYYVRVEDYDDEFTQHQHDKPQYFNWFWKLLGC